MMMFSKNVVCRQRLVVSLGFAHKRENIDVLWNLSKNSTAKQSFKLAGCVYLTIEQSPEQSPVLSWLVVHSRTYQTSQENNRWLDGWIAQQPIGSKYMTDPHRVTRVISQHNSADLNHFLTYNMIIHIFLYTHPF